MPNNRPFHELREENLRARAAKHEKLVRRRRRQATAIFGFLLGLGVTLVGLVFFVLFRLGMAL